MATFIPAGLPLALIDEKGISRWLFTIHTNRRLKVIRNPGRTAADDMYATSYTVQGIDGGWDAEGNPFVFVLSENGMIYHIHHQPPHWQHRAVTRLPLTRTCTNFQAGILDQSHVLLIQHTAQGDTGRATSHYRVMGRDILPVDTSPLPRSARHLYVQTGAHIACLQIDREGQSAYSLLTTDTRQWTAPIPLPYALGSEATPALIGMDGGFHMFWYDSRDHTGHHAAVSYGADTQSAPQAFPLDITDKEYELGWDYRPDAPIPMWQTGDNILGKDPHRSQHSFRYQGAGGNVTPVRVVRADPRHHRITYRTFAAVSGFTIIRPGMAKEGTHMENTVDEDRLQRIEQRQKQLVAQLKDMYISMTQMQDEMMRQSRVLFQLESVTGTRSRNITTYAGHQEDAEPEEPHPKNHQSGLHIKDVQ
mgnify:CR=1 FL=1